MELSNQSQSLIMHFGEMGSRWGFNRTIGQLLGLLFVSPSCLNAEEMMKILSISRSNVSMALKELLSWGLIQVKHQPHDRKEYFTVIGDVWAMAHIVLEQRRKREIDPTRTLLQQHLSTKPSNESEHYAHQQMQQMYELLTIFDQCADQLRSIKPEQLKSMMKLGSNLSKMLSVKDKVV